MVHEIAKKDYKDETPREKFKRLAALRTNEVLKRLKILGNCANRYAYDYTEEDVQKIFAAIEQEVKAVKAKFIQPGEREFKL